MKPIENVKLDELLTEVSSNLIEDKKKSATGIIKSMFIKLDQIAKEIDSLDKEKARKQKMYDDTMAKVEKIKSGDWSVIQDPKEENNPT